MKMSHTGTIRRIGTAKLLDRFCRLIWPIPTSPSPKMKEDEYKLQLVPASALTRRLVEILRILNAASNEPIGDYIEFGVYNGTSMGCMFDALSQLKFNCVRLFGFDSFMGLPPEVSSEDGGVWKPGQFACPKQVTAENLALRGIPLDRVHFVEGWYKDTLKHSASTYGIQNVSTVMIDCDTYSSARLALEFIYPFLDKTSAIIFDDWKLNNLDIKGMGEFRAFNELVSSHPELSLKPCRGYNRKSKIFIVTKGS